MVARIETFRLTMECIAPDAAEDVRSVIRTAQWVLDSVDEDPEVIAQHRRGIQIIESWLQDRIDLVDHCPAKGGQ